MLNISNKRKKGDYIILFISILLLLQSCNPIPAIEETSTLYPSPEPTLTIEPTMTLNPTGDPDGDGYQTSFEEAWGSDPKTFTSFEDLKNLGGVTSFTLHLREPYNFEDMNSTVYQQAKIIFEEEIEDSGFFDKGPFKTLAVDMVTFPYVDKIVGEYVKSLKFPYYVPVEIEDFLDPTTTSDTCEEEREMIQSIINRVDNVYELSSKIYQWNVLNLNVNPQILMDKLGLTMRYRDLSSVKTSQIMELGIIGHSTMQAIKAASDFKEAGIPSGIALSFDANEINLELHNKDLEEHMNRTNNHPQTAVWTPKYGWVIYDYNLGFANSRPSGSAGLVITEIAPDFSDFNMNLWFNNDDGGEPVPDWLFYSE